MTHARDRGDTLIEVLVAMAVLGALVALTYNVMNRGFASGQNSLDSTRTQALTSGQAALLRAAHARAVFDNDLRYWNLITDPGRTPTITTTSTPVDRSKLADGCSSAVGLDSLFYFDPKATEDAVAQTGPLAPVKYFSGVTPDPAKLVRTDSDIRPGDGLWIEGYKENGSNFYVFYIKACWEPTYGDGTGERRQSKTVLRLYGP